MTTREVFAATVWADMLALYEVAGVPGLCLSLQDTHGVDVPLLLTLALADAKGIGANEAEVATLIDGAALWRDMAVRPLRKLRQDLKPHANDAATTVFREKVKALELDAEHRHVDRIAAALVGMTGSDPLAAAYLSRAGLPRAEADAALSALTAAIDAAPINQSAKRTQ